MPRYIKYRWGNYAISMEWHEYNRSEEYRALNTLDQTYNSGGLGTSMLWNMMHGALDRYLETLDHRMSFWVYRLVGKHTHWTVRSSQDKNSDIVLNWSETLEALERIIPKVLYGR